MPDEFQNTSELPIEQLKNICDPSTFDFANTAELSGDGEVIGQKRALKSFDFGFKIKTEGFNMFVSGPTGTNKLTAVKDYVERFSADEPVPSDWCYVNNFKHPDRPKLIELAAGKGSQFVSDMEELVEGAKNEIPKAFEEEEYEKRKSAIMKEFHAERDKILEELSESARKKGFTVELTPAGIITVPIIEDKPMHREEYEKLPGDHKKALQDMTEDIQTETKLILSRVRTLEKEIKERVHQLDQEIALFAVGHLLDELRDKYADHEKIMKYLNNVQKDIIKNLETFKNHGKGQAALPGLEFMMKKPSYDKYKVNLLVNNSETEGAPVIYESNPTYYNLFGKLEYTAQFGAFSTGFQMVKPGAIHRANGGYLIINALNMLLNLMSYDALKRTIKDKQVRIENIGEHFQAIPAATLRPEPMPVNVKIILIGSPMIYNLLFRLDEDFQRLFKVKADFDTVMERDDDGAQRYAHLIANKCRESSLLHFDPSGVAEVVNYGSRIPEDQKKLSTKLMQITDMISEASFWAFQEGAPLVSASHVKKALDEKIYRSNMIEQKIQEFIERNILMIDTEGEKEGQINGLSVSMLGDYMFGKPSRITARTFVGRKGLVNIEREIKMSGRIHNKGVLILGGYIGGKYGSKKPVSISASLTFEQLYDEIEGDSASSTELYCLLSSLAEVPLRQGIAVTGSVNQKGEVQAIGGVNHKIEGYFDVCKAKGLTGEQGVMIPQSNVENLMLKDEVIEAIKAGNFHIWSVSSIDEGIQILTGMKAGELQADGTYPKDTFNWKISRKLDEFLEITKKFGPNEEMRRAA